ncbi:MAG: hypothetical protein OHK006_15620 [Thermodesulfovibrionales bacterium]
MEEPHDRRRHRRIGYDMPVEFSVSMDEFAQLDTATARAVGVDISDEGMGFVTDFKVEPGHLLRIERGDGTALTAEVRWVGAIEGKYRVGVIFYRENTS